MQNKKEIQELANWTNEVNKVCIASNSLCIALLDNNGNFLYTNDSFDYFCKNEENKCLLNPDFNKIQEKLEYDNFFKGYITIGNLEDNISLTGSIFKKENEYLIIGEINTKEIIQEQKTLFELNQQINNLQRDLLREKRKLSATLDELRQANEKLVHTNNQKNRFLGIAAHDIRNPLGLIREFSKLISSDFEELTKEEKLTYLNIICDRADFSLKLLNELLDLSKIESGTINLNIVKENYAEFVKDKIELNKVLAERKRIRVMLIIPSKPMIANFDKEKMEQVFNNLLSNAIKFSNEESTILIRLTEVDKFIKTEVIDQGLGISEEEKEKIFQPFHKGSAKPTKGEKSTGLGLAITKRIIEEHKGNIDVESKPGQGSKFYYLLPLTN